MTTTTAAQAAADAAQAAAELAFFRSLDLSERNKENLPPWLLEEREPVWERQRAALAAWRPTPEQESRYRARHPPTPEQVPMTHDITFNSSSASSTLPIIRPRRVRGDWHEIFLQEWNRPVAAQPQKWVSGAGRGNPVPQPFLNSPILDADGNLLNDSTIAAMNLPGWRPIGSSRSASPELPQHERPVQSARRRPPLPISFSTPEIPTQRIVRRRAMSLSPLSNDEDDNGFEIYVDPEERGAGVEAQGVEDLYLLSLMSMNASNNEPEVGPMQAAVQELSETMSSILIMNNDDDNVDEPNGDQENTPPAATASRPADTPKALAVIHRRVRSSTYPGNRDQYTFAPFEIPAEGLPSPAKLNFPPLGPIADVPSGSVQLPSNTPAPNAPAIPFVSPSLEDFQEFKKSFPRRVRLALELNPSRERRVQSLITQPSPPLVMENGFLEAMQV